MRERLIATALYVLLACATSCSFASIRVEDSIAMTRLVEPNADYVEFFEPKFNWSPDRRYVSLVTRQGSLATGRNTFSLLLLDVRQMQDYVNASINRTPPPLITLAKVESASANLGIRDVQWLPDGRRIAFIGQFDDQPGQVFVVDIKSLQVTQLTWHAHNIARYGMAEAGRLLVFSADTPPDWTIRNTRGYAFKSQDPGSMAKINPREGRTELHYFVIEVGSTQARELDVSPSSYPKDIAASPNSAMALLTVHDVFSLPNAWLEYSDVAQRVKLARGETQGRAGYGLDLHDEIFGGPIDWIGRHVLVDLGSGRMRDFLDTPVMLDWRVPATAWSKDGSLIAVGPVFLPLSSARGSEYERRQRSRAVAIVDTKTHDVTRISEVAQGVSVRQIVWPAHDEVMVYYADAKGADLGPKKYRRIRGSWRESPAIRARSSPNFTLSIRQDMNTPPDIEAVDHLSQRRRLVTNFNPALNVAVQGQRIEKLEWKDGNGEVFQGGLILPDGYQTGRRYPVVLQTYGFAPNAFLIDGPIGITSAYAARPLAAAGFVVLQMNTRISVRTACANWEPCGENGTFTSIVEAAIDALDSRGLIDRQRVGLVGWSREGMHVFHTITFGKYPIAAATIADAIAYTPLGYVMAYGAPFPGMLDFEQMIGGPYWGVHMRDWHQRSPIFHLDRIQAALRFESYGAAITDYWDAFARLKRARHPVELIHLPIETHILQTPYGRYTSQQGNVDWFRFWLMNEEDSDPAKAEQYQRWRLLRKR